MSEPAIDRCGRIVDGIYYPPADPREVLWELPAPGRWRARWWDAWKFVSFSPSAFFATLRPEAGAGRAILFALPCVAIGQAVAIAHGGWLEGILVDQMRRLVTAEEFAAVRGLTQGVLVSQVVLFPVGVISAMSLLCVQAGGYVLAGWLLGRPARFELALRVTCYAQSTHLFSLVPALGCLCVQPFYYVFLIFLGLKYAAGWTTGQALFGVALAPLILVLFVGGGMYNLLAVSVLANLLAPGA